MKVTVILILFTMILFLLQSEAFISINIDPEDLDQVTDFIHTVTINDQSQPIISNRKNRVIISMVKKAIFSTIQLVGVMLSLVGANIISVNLVPDASMQQKQQFPQSENILPNQNKTIKIKFGEMCHIDYGCNKNLCWRTCNTVADGKKLWCYTSPTSRKFQYCAHANECSLCWDCIEPCHA